MLASGTGAALGAPLRTAGGWKTGAQAVGETPAFGAPPALGAPPASGLDLRFILGRGVDRGGARRGPGPSQILKFTLKI